MPDILAAGDSLQLHNGMLEAISSRDHRRLWRLIKQAAASRLGISRNTARSHLRAVFAKTGVKRQTALAQLLLCSVVALD